MTESIRLTTSSPRLAMDIRGAGEPLVFLHGIGGNRTNWAAQLAALSDQFLCVAFDFRGYGDSEDISDGLDFFDFVEDVRHVLAENGISRCHLMGLSMGGLVAQAYYTRHPSSVISLGLIGCRPGSAPVFEDSKTFAEERTKPLEGGNSAEALADSLLPRLLGPSVGESERETIRRSLAQIRPASYRKVLSARLSIAPFLQLGDIDVPTLVVAGTHDQVAPMDQMQAMAAAIPDSVLKVVPNAGHLMNIEQPDLFTGYVRDFLTGVERSASS
ncbi:MAG: alpha/beta fold hydrolase [Pseudorhodoplanes sp.]